MPVIPLVPLLISAGVSAGKAISQGVKAKKERKRLESLERPVYEQSEMLTQNLADAQQKARQGLPSELYQQQERNIDRSVSNALSSPAMAGSGVAGLGNVVQSQADAFSDLITQDAVARERNRQQVANARTALASEEARAFQLNSLDPYNQQLASGQANLGAALQGMYSGIDELGSTAIQAASMYGGGGAGGTAPVMNTPQGSGQLSPDQMQQMQLWMANMAQSGNPYSQGM